MAELHVDTPTSSRERAMMPKGSAGLRRAFEGGSLVIYRVNTWRHAHSSIVPKGRFWRRKGKIADARDRKAPRALYRVFFTRCFPGDCLVRGEISFFDEMVASRRGLHGRI